MMISTNMLMLASFLLSIIVCFDVGYSQTSCPKSAEYDLSSTGGRAYRNNVESLLSELSSKGSNPNGFYNFTAVNSSTATVHGLFYCRFDATPIECETCVANACSDILQTCPNTTWAVRYEDKCMLRFSNESIFSRLDTRPDATWYAWNVANVSDPTLFNQVLGDAFNYIASEAAKMVSGKKYAARESNYTSFQNKVYSMGQCTPDLSSLDCESCLRQAVSKLPDCCNNKQGGNVLCPSCRIRYETYPYFTLPSSSPPPQTVPDLAPPPPAAAHISPARKQDNVGISTIKIITIVVPIISILGFVALFFCIAMKSKRRKTSNFIGRTSEYSENNISSHDTASLRYKFSEIQAFTDNFADENILGRGGFGPVYKGTLPNGQIVAVKRLSRGSTQGGDEFINEIALVAKLQHRNLVRLLGYCLEGEENILIYEFVPNKSLDYFLFDPEKQPMLDWLTRYKIIEGIARGLLYLHEDSRVKIIHRDLKSGNVLLDQNMNAKIADFGMARLLEIDQSVGNTSRIAGTYYMAPEYAMHGIMSVKSDVFSFGVLVLEIISGKKISNNTFFGGDDLLTYVWKNWRDGTPLAVMDPAIGERFDRNAIIRCIHIGLLCVAEDVETRPTMALVILMLNSDSTSLSIPNQPAYFVRSIISKETPIVSKSDKSSSHPENSGNELSITELYPR